MKITQVTVTYGRKINLGEFNQYHGEVTLVADVEDDDLPSKVIEDLTDQAREAVRLEYHRLTKPKDE